MYIRVSTRSAALLVFSVNPELEDLIVINLRKQP